MSRSFDKQTLKRFIHDYLSLHPGSNYTFTELAEIIRHKMKASNGMDWILVPIIQEMAKTLDRKED